MVFLFDFLDGSDMLPSDSDMLAKSFRYKSDMDPIVYIGIISEPYRRHIGGISESYRKEGELYASEIGLEKGPDLGGLKIVL